VLLTTPPMASLPTRTASADCCAFSTTNDAANTAAMAANTVLEYKSRFLMKAHPSKSNDGQIIRKAQLGIGQARR
jgi:hypothetical protein